MVGSKITYSDAEVLDISKRQRAVLWLILLSIPVYAASIVEEVLFFLPFIMAVVSLVFIYQLAAALKVTAPGLHVVLGLMPSISLIALYWRREAPGPERPSTATIFSSRAAKCRS